MACPCPAWAAPSSAAVPTMALPRWPRSGCGPSWLAAQALSAYAGHLITYVKAHGTLGNLAQTDAGVAGAITQALEADGIAVRSFAPSRAA